MSEILLDRRILSTDDDVDPTFADGSTTWTLPYALPTNGSAGVVQVVTAAGVVLETTRPSTTEVAAVGDFSSTLVYIGVQYALDVSLSTLYFRTADYTGIPKADSRKRLQLHRVRFTHEDTRAYEARVQGSERSVAAYPFSSTADDNGSLRVPVLSNNEQVTIALHSSSPLPVWITGLEWEGQFKPAVRLR